MSTTYHADIALGASGNANTVNTPLGQLDAAIVTLDARVDGLVLAGGNISTLANGTAAAGQGTVTVDSSTGFIAGGRVAYALAGGTLEYSTINTVGGATQIVLDTNIGTGGIADNGLITMISETEYQAAVAIPYGNSHTPTLDSTIASIGKQRHYPEQYRALGNGSNDDSTAIQAALDAIKTAGAGELVLAGTYNIGTATLKYQNNVYGDSLTIIGSGKFGGGVISANDSDLILDLSGSSHVTMRNVRITTAGTSSGVGLLLARTSDANGGHSSDHLFDGVTIQGDFSKACVVALGAEVNTWVGCALMNDSDENGTYVYYTGTENDLSVSTTAGTIIEAAGGATNSHHAFFGGKIMHMGSGEGTGLAICADTHTLSLYGVYLYSPYRDVELTYSSAGGIIYGPLQFDSCHFEGTAYGLYHGSVTVYNLIMQGNHFGVTPADNNAIYQLTANKSLNNSRIRNNYFGTAHNVRLDIVYDSDIGDCPALSVQTVARRNKFHDVVPTFTSGLTSNYHNIVFDTGKWMLGDTVNTKMSTGITLQQAASTDEILTFKSTDVGHGATSVTEADTFGAFTRYVSTYGGVQLSGFNDYGTADSGNSPAVVLRGVVSAADTRKTTSGVGAVTVNGCGISGTVLATLGTVGNIMALRNNGTTAYIFDADGGAHALIDSWTAMDDYDDVALLDTLNDSLSQDRIGRAFGEYVFERRDVLERERIISYDPESSDRVALNMTRLAMLQTGAIRQLADKLDNVTSKLELAERKLAALEA